MSYHKHWECVCGYVFSEPITDQDYKGEGDQEFIIVSSQEDCPNTIACPKCGTLKLDI